MIKNSLHPLILLWNIDRDHSMEESEFADHEHWNMDIQNS